MFVVWVDKSIGSVWVEKSWLDEFVFTPNSTCFIGCVCENLWVGKFVFISTSQCCIGWVCENVFFPLLL